MLTASLADLAGTLKCCSGIQKQCSHYFEHCKLRVPVWCNAPLSVSRCNLGVRVVSVSAPASAAPVECLSVSEHAQCASPPAQSVVHHALWSIFLTHHHHGPLAAPLHTRTHTHKWNVKDEMKEKKIEKAHLMNNLHQQGWETHSNIMIGTTCVCVCVTYCLQLLVCVKSPAEFLLLCVV